MPSLIAALSLALASSTLPAQAEAESARCALLAFGDRIAYRGPDALEARCPDLPGLQAAADAALAQVDLAGIDRNLAADRFSVASDIQFSFDGAWRADPGQVLVRAFPEFPDRSRRSGADHMACALALEPDAAGRPMAPAAECVSDRAGVRIFMVRDIELAAQSWRLLPTQAQYCVDEQVYIGAEPLDNDIVFSRGSILSGASAGGARPGNWPVWRALPPTQNALPDSEQLPNLCQARIRAS